MKYDATDLFSINSTKAAQLLGKLEPIYHDEALFNLLKGVIVNDGDAQVRDSAYEALLRLASAPKSDKLTDRS